MLVNEAGGEVDKGKGNNEEANEGIESGLILDL